MKSIREPRIVWILGDKEQQTVSGVTQVVRPLYYQPKNQDAPPIRVGEINPDYADKVLTALTKGAARSK